MIYPESTIARDIRKYCAEIGTDALLVQGAGGNVSWKEGSTLWIKASGMWLAEAESKQIFVPVDLLHLRDAISKQDFTVKPKTTCNSKLRPSIETLLHALMPHRVVVHLHAVEILAYLVRVNAKQIIESLIGDTVNWGFVDYFKPGSDLARAISEEIKNGPDADVLFMGNHGVVIGGANVDDVATLLDTLIFKLKTKVAVSEPENCPARFKSDFFRRGYIPCGDRDVNQLASKHELISRLRHEWALYPDHVVFLGAEPNLLERDFTINDLDERTYSKPPFIIAIGDSVYENTEATPNQKQQLRCYFDVVTRQNSKEKLSTLTTVQVSDLLDWDAEKYRKIINE